MSKKESLLSLSVRAFGTPYYRFTVPKGAFSPAPSVDSAVLSITQIKSPFPSDVVEARFFEILHAGFAHKRKQLANNLEEIFTAESVSEALEETHSPQTVRAEDVPLSAWLIFASVLKK